MPRPLYSLRVAFPKTDTGWTTRVARFSGQPIFEFAAMLSRPWPPAPGRTYWISIADADLRTGQWLWSRGADRGPVATRSEVGDYTDSWIVEPHVDVPAFREQ